MSCQAPVGAVRSEPARLALAEARARGWSVRLAGGQVVIAAPLRSLSPALLDRLQQFEDRVTDLLVEGRCP